MFSNGYAWQKIDNKTNAPPSRAILMAMQIRWYNAIDTIQYGRAWATLLSTGRQHRAGIQPVLPWQTQLSSISVSKTKLWRCEITLQS